MSWSFDGLDPQAAALALVVALALSLLVVWRRPLHRRMTVAFAAAWAQALAATRRGFAMREACAALLFFGALASAAAALSLPRLAARPPRRIAIVVDASASMQARGADGHSCIERAREIAQHVLASKRAQDRVAIFRAASSVELLEPWELDSLDADDSAGAPELALATARTFLAGDDEKHLVVISDRPDLFAGADVEPLGAGAPAENLFVADAGAFALAAPETGWEIRVAVGNGGKSAGSATLVLHDAKFRVGTAHVEIAPGALVTRAFRVADLPAGAMWASLDAQKFSSGAPDALAADDRRGFFVPARAALRVSLVTAGNRFLAGALAAQPGIGLRIVSPASPIPPADVVILDRVDGGAGLAAILRIDGPTDSDLLAPVLSEWNGDHPATRQVSLDDLTIARARVLVPGPGDIVLAAAESGPIALARTRNGHREIELGFDPSHSDFPLRLSFPVFVGDSVRWLAGRDGDAPRTAAPGVAGVALPLPAVSEPLEAVLAPNETAPSASAARIVARGDGEALLSTHAGLFRAGAVEAAIGIDPGESALTATRGDARLPPWTQDAGASASREYAPLLFAAAAILLTAKAWLS